MDPALAEWADAHARLTATMVDRIVPAATRDDITRVSTLTGHHDAAPVANEPFRQWVIEDDFVGGIRPGFAVAGAQMVRDVAPFEPMKLRMLNGTHSALAYLGYLGSHEAIADCMTDPAYRALVPRLWASEIIPALTRHEGVDLVDYVAALEDRYANLAIHHRTWQIAMDGSRKLPQRVLGTLAGNVAAGRPSPGLTLVIAAWMTYVDGVDEAGRPIDVRAPMSARPRTLSNGFAEDRVTAMPSVGEVFPQSLTAAIAPEVTAAFRNLQENGARHAVRELT